MEQTFEVDELTGSFIDAALAQTLGYQYNWFNNGTKEQPDWLCCTKDKNPFSSKFYIRGEEKKNWFGRVIPKSLEPIGYIFSPSTEWDKGGIIFSQYNEAILNHVNKDITTWPKGDGILPYLMKAFIKSRIAPATKVIRFKYELKS